jgi:outer membrane protein assembly factor BamE
MQVLPSHAARLALAACACALVAGCGSFDRATQRIAGVITPYRIDIVQGNFVSREQVEALKPGMSRLQVRDILGTPLVADVFHRDRWDYVFTIRRQGAPAQQHSVVVLFENDVLKSIDTGGELPGEREFVASIDTNKPPRRQPVLALTDEQKKALPVPPRPPAAEPAPEVATRTYPPLEATP